MTTRRNFLAGLALVPVLAAPATSAASATDSVEWDAAMTDYMALKAKADRFHAEVYHPAIDAAKDMRPPYRFTHTAKNGHAVEYSLWPDDFAKYEPDAVDMWTYIRPQIDEAKAKYAAYSASPLPAKLERLNKQSDDYNDELTDAEDVLLCLPAPHLDAVAWKLRHLQEVSADCVIKPGAIANVLFDVRRINGEDVA